MLCLVGFITGLAGCGQPKFIDGTTYPTYGFFNEKTKKDPKIVYEISIGNVIWSIILCETVVFPVYFVGFSLYNPICKVGENPVTAK